MLSSFNNQHRSNVTFEQQVIPFLSLTVLLCKIRKNSMHKYNTFQPNFKLH